MAVASAATRSSVFTAHSVLPRWCTSQLLPGSRSSVWTGVSCEVRNGFCGLSTLTFCLSEKCLFPLSSLNDSLAGHGTVGDTCHTQRFEDVLLSSGNVCRCQKVSCQSRGGFFWGDLSFLTRGFCDLGQVWWTCDFVTACPAVDSHLLILLWI